MVLIAIFPSKIGLFANLTLTMISHIHSNSNKLKLLLLAIISVPMQNLVSDSFSDQVGSCSHVSKVQHAYLDARRSLQLIESINVNLYSANDKFSFARARSSGGQ